MDLAFGFVFGLAPADVEAELTRWLGPLAESDEPTFTLFSPSIGGDVASTVVRETHTNAEPTWAQALSRRCGWVLWMRSGQAAYAYYAGVLVETALEPEALVATVTHWHTAIEGYAPHWQPFRTTARSVAAAWRPYGAIPEVTEVRRAIFEGVELEQLAAFAIPPDVRWLQLASPILQVPYCIVDGELPSGWVVAAAHALDRAAVEIALAADGFAWTIVRHGGGVETGRGRGVVELANVLSAVTISSGEHADFAGGATVRSPGRRTRDRSRETRAARRGGRSEPGVRSGAARASRSRSHR